MLEWKENLARKADLPHLSPTLSEVGGPKFLMFQYAIPTAHLIIVLL